MIFMYFSTMLAVAIFAASSALFGVHLASKDQSSKILTKIQAAFVGYLLSLLWIGGSNHNLFVSILSFIISLLSCYLVSSLLNYIQNRNPVSLNTYYIAVYTILLSSGFLLVSLSPNIELHVAGGMYGDVVTISSGAQWIFIVWSFFSLFYLKHYGSELISQSFMNFTSSHVRNSILKSRGIFDLLVSIHLCLSVIHAGILFTLTVIFIPTSVVSLFLVRGLNAHLAIVLISSISGVFMGFLLSLSHASLPTTPMIAVAVLVFTVISCSIDKWVRRSA